ncbi:hypothetical protein INR49_008737 [Caranx melampygus]|nr:hypothetical protein INR49_008737 [Caranx melampygus]
MPMPIHDLRLAGAGPVALQALQDTLSQQFNVSVGLWCHIFTNLQYIKLMYDSQQLGSAHLQPLQLVEGEGAQTLLQAKQGLSGHLGQQLVCELLWEEHSFPEAQGAVRALHTETLQILAHIGQAQYQHERIKDVTQITKVKLTMLNKPEAMAIAFKDAL